jgi:chromosome segregation ATPase
MAILVRNIIILISLMICFVMIYRQEQQKIRNDFSLPPSERRVHYRIGTIDPRFNLTEDQAKQLLAEAEMIWEKPLARQIFFYNPKALFKINFIYDQRQQSLNLRQQEEDILAENQDQNDSAKADFEQQKTVLDDQYRLHAEALNQLNSRIMLYKQRVELLNSQGGATQMETQSLQDESSQINQEVVALNQKNADLDAKKASLQNQATTVQSKIANYNQKVQDYNQNYTGRSFEAGQYKGDEINIYEYDNQDNLRLILAHELGHSLGLKHSNNPRALMYPTLKDQDQLNFKLTQADIDLLYQRVPSY